MTSTDEIHMEPVDKNNSRISRGQFVWAPVFVVAIVHLLALLSIFYYSPSNFIGFFIAYLIFGGLGAVIGLHRYFSHKSFACTSWFEHLLAICATLNLQNGPITWAMYHRAHHRYNESKGDPHSANEGFMWSHILWLFYLAPNGFRKSSVSVSDLTTSKFLVWLDKHYIFVNIMAPTLFLLGTQNIGLTLWVFPLRIVIVWHLTWLINSYVHRATLFPNGQRPKGIRNSFVISILMFGDGWHLNHHNHPSLSRAGLEWYQVDFAYVLLLILRHLRVIKLKSKL